MAAESLKNSQSYLGARYRSLRGRLGAPKAIKAMARYLACLVYRMLKYGKEYVRQSLAEYEAKVRRQMERALQRKAAALGYQLIPKGSSASKPSVGPVLG